jgi:hypothetical protein
MLPRPCLPVCLDRSPLDGARRPWADALPVDRVPDRFNMPARQPRVKYGPRPS